MAQEKKKEVKRLKEELTFTEAGKVLAKAGFTLLDMAPAGPFKLPPLGGLPPITVSATDAGNGVKFLVPSALGLPNVGFDTRYGSLQMSAVEGGTQVTFVPTGKVMEGVLSGALSAAKLYGLLSSAFVAVNLASPVGVAVIAACIAVGLLRLTLCLWENHKAGEEDKAEQEEPEEEEEKEKELEPDMLLQEGEKVKQKQTISYQ